MAKGKGGMEVGDLLVRLSLDMDDLTKGLGKAFNELQKFNKNTDAMEKTLKTVGKNMKSAMGDVEDAVEKVARRVDVNTNRTVGYFKRLRSDVQETTKAINASAASMAGGFGALEHQLAAIGKTLNNIASNKSLSQMSGHMRETSHHAETLMGRFRVTSLNLYIIQYNLRMIADLMRSTLGPGLSFAANMEQAQIGMSGILMSMTTLHGKQLDINEAQAISADIMRKISDAALATTSTTEELTNVFQALLAPGLRAKMTTDEILQITIAGANAVKAIGLNSQQMVQELRDLVAGGITTASSTLATALGLKDADIEAARNSADGLFKFLMERLSGFAEASKLTENSMQGITSNIEDGFKRMAGEASKPIFDKLKRELGQVQDMFFTITKRNEKGIPIKAELNADTLNKFKLVASAIGEIWSGINRLYVGAKPFLEEIGRIFYDIFKFVYVLVASLGDFKDVLNGAAEGKALEFLKGVREVFDKLANNVPLATGAIAAFFAILNAGTILSAFETGVLKGMYAMDALRVVCLKILPVLQAVVTGNFALAGSFLVANFKIVAIAIVIGALVATLTFLAVHAKETAELFSAAFEGLKSGVIIILNHIMEGVTWFAKSSVKLVMGVINLFASIPGKIGEAFKGAQEFGNSLIGELDAQQQKFANNAEDGANSWEASKQRVLSAGGELIEAAKNDANKFAVIWNNAFNPEVYDYKGKGFGGSGEVDASGLASKYANSGDDKGARRAAREAMREELAELDGKLKLLQMMLQQKQAELDAQFSKGLISVREYYTQTAQIMTDGTEAEIAVLNQKMAVEDSLAGKQKIQNEIDQKNLALKSALWQNNEKMIKSYKDLENEVNKVNIAFAKFTGNLQEAAVLEVTSNDNIKSMLVYYSEMEDAKRAVAEALKSGNQSAIEQARNVLATWEEVIAHKLQMAKDDVRVAALNELQSKSETITKQQNAEIARQNMLVDIGAKTKKQATQEVIDLQKQEAQRLLDINKTQQLITESMTGADKEKRLAALKEEEAALIRLREQQSAGVLEWTNRYESAFNTMIDNILDGTMKLRDILTNVFKDIANSWIKSVSEPIMQGFARQLAGWKTPNTSGGTADGTKVSGTDAATAAIADKLSQSKVIEASTMATLNPALQAFGGQISTIGGSLATTVNPAITALGTNTATAGGALTTFATTSIPPVQTALGMLSSAAMSAATALQSVSAGGTTSFFPFHAAGGYISGAGTSTSDSIPSWLSNGEYVINAAVVQKFGKNFFDMVNGGHLPQMRFATGGYVGSSSSPTNGSAGGMNFKVEVINKTDKDVNAEVGNIKFNGVEYVMQMWLTGVSKNTLGSRDLLKGMR